MMFGKGNAATGQRSLGSGGERVTVTAAEFTRRFCQLTKVHRNVPIHVTNHGQETHVLLASDTYSRLIQADDPAVIDASDCMPTLSELGAWIRQGLIVVDREQSIQYANPVFHMMAGVSDGTLVGRDFLSVLPQLQNTLLSGYLQRALCGGERQTADFPSLLRADAWYRADFIPCRQGAMLLLTDITDEVRQYRLADAKVALVNALEEHGGVGYARINLRARIDRVDTTLAEMLSVPQERLVGNYIADLVPLSDRVAFKEQLEGVLSGESTASCRTKLITNQGNVIEVKVAIAELRGTYGGEGAVLVITNAAGETDETSEPSQLARRQRAH